MSLSKAAVIAVGLALGLSTAGVATKVYAQAQNNPGNMLTDVGDDEIVYMKAGKMTKGKMKMNAAMHTKAMGMGGKEVDPKSTSTTGMYYKHNGKFYHVENKAAASGKGMVQENFQEVFDGAHQY